MSDPTLLDVKIRYELSNWLGYRYTNPAAGERALCPTPSLLTPPAVVWKPGQKRTTVCCVFVMAVLGAVFKLAPWGANAWALGMITAKDRPWGVIDACVQAGVARPAEGPPSPGKWYVEQGWTGLVDGKIVEASRGHQWLRYGTDLIVEATTFTDEDADNKSTDRGAVMWRMGRTWQQQDAKYDRVVRAELIG